MSDLKPFKCDLNLLNDRICNLSAGLATMTENETMKVNKAFLTAILGYMEELLGMCRAQPANEPLTIEQLREMGYEWVWVERIGRGELPKSVLKYINGYGYVLAKHQKVKICDICLFFDDYGKTWLAYRQKPEGSDRDGQTR